MLENHMVNGCAHCGANEKLDDWGLCEACGGVFDDEDEEEDYDDY